MQTVKTVGLYGITHAMVDAACITVMFSTAILNNLSYEYSFTIIVLYNILAFGTQCIIGNIFDKLNKPRLCAVIGCILTAMSALLWKYPIAAVLCAGFGNAFFHVGGGIICLRTGKRNSAIPGMYVAPGALGLFLGMLIAKNSLFPPYIMAVVLILCAILIYFYKEEGGFISDESCNPVKYNKFLLICNFLLFAIAIRSFVGLGISLPWHENLLLMCCLTLAVVCGKFFGGIIADKFGWLKVTVFALLISSPMIAYGINLPALYITGIFFFNFTMPVTLTALANMMPKREGYAFGLTTLFLIIGALPSFYIPKLGAGNEILIFLAVLLSAVLIFIGLKEYTKNHEIS
jgi:FSR family fosmidomycin resistance protein-like MFS transporter